MRRRTFIAGLGGAAASAPALWPLAAWAQQADRVRRIGVLMPYDENDPYTKLLLSAFTQALADSGWADGRNVRVDLRWGDGDTNRIRALARELASLQPDIILAGSTPATAALQRETGRTILIVFVDVGDPVASGLVARLDRPSGNITGFAVCDRMRRRVFIAGLGAAAWPLAARAQQGERVRRVGVLMNGAATEAIRPAYVKAFTEALSKSGWIEGKNVSIDIRYNAGDPALARIFAAQLIGLMPDVILASSTTNLTMIREVTNTVPIVFTSVSDPIEQGFVPSLAKPGGNITGFSQYDFSVGGKWLGVLKQMAPGLARIAVMFNPDTSPQSNFFMRSIGAAGSSLGVAVTATMIRTTADIEPAIENFARLPNGGLILPTDSFMVPRFKFIADTANRHRLPSLAHSVTYPRDGGLMYYGTGRDSAVETFRRAANYVDRILKGERPGDLPVQTPTRYEMVINLKTARAIGLDVSPTLLALADEVIE